MSIGPYTYAFPGVRIALWGGGLITFVAGFVAWRSIRKAERLAAASGEAPPEHEGRSSRSGRSVWSSRRRSPSRSTDADDADEADDDDADAGAAP